jgi:hypothetical protein
MVLTFLPPKSIQIILYSRKHRCFWLPTSQDIRRTCLVTWLKSHDIYSVVFLASHLPKTFSSMQFWACCNRSSFHTQAKTPQMQEWSKKAATWAFLTPTLSQSFDVFLGDGRGSCQTTRSKWKTLVLGHWFIDCSFSGAGRVDADYRQTCSHVRAGVSRCEPMCNFIIGLQVSTKCFPVLLLPGRDEPHSAAQHHHCEEEVRASRVCCIQIVLLVVWFWILITNKEDWIIFGHVQFRYFFSGPIFVAFDHARSAIASIFLIDIPFLTIRVVDWAAHRSKKWNVVFFAVSVNTHSWQFPVHEWWTGAQRKQTRTAKEADSKQISSQAALSLA